MRQPTSERKSVRTRACRIKLILAGAVSASFGPALFQVAAGFGDIVDQFSGPHRHCLSFLFGSRRGYSGMTIRPLTLTMLRFRDKLQRTRLDWMTPRVAASCVV